MPELSSDSLAERLTPLADKHGVVGASVAVLAAGAVTEAATGVLHLRTGAAVTPDSVFQIGSISKVWTATLVGQLVDEGLVDLDAPVVRYVPTFTLDAAPDRAAAVTVRELLSHTSGIDGDFFHDTGRGDDCLERYVAAMAQLTPTHPRGTLMSYCNAGYSLLGRLVELVRGQTWDAVLRERLLGPLGLDAAGTLPEEALLHPAAVGHLWSPGATEATLTPQWGIYRSAGPAGLIHSRARDQITFAQLHLTGGVAADGTRLLSAATAAAMRTPQIALPDPWTLGTHWGLGWILDSWGGTEVFGHDGATLGQQAYLRVLPEAGVAVSLLTNGGRATRALFHDLVTELATELAGVAPLPPPVPPAQPVGLDAATLVGTYAREGVELLVREPADGPAAAPAGSAPVGDLELVVRATGPLAGAAPPQRLTLRGYDTATLLARPVEGAADAAWTPVSVLDVDGERYLHFGARATRRVGPLPDPAPPVTDGPLTAV